MREREGERDRDTETNVDVIEPHPLAASHRIGPGPGFLGLGSAL